MITKKKLQQQVDQLTEEIKKLSELVINDEMKYLREEKKRFDEQTELLSNVKFRVKNAKIIDENVVITYQLPIITLKIDDNGDPMEKVPFFYAVNSLGLVGIEDYEVIQKILLKAKNYKTNKNNY